MTTTKSTTSTMKAIVQAGAGGAGTMGGAAPVIAYGTAAFLAIGYGLLRLAISGTVLARRDVTS